MDTLSQSEDSEGGILQRWLRVEGSGGLTSLISAQALATECGTLFDAQTLWWVAATEPLHCLLDTYKSEFKERRVKLLTEQPAPSGGDTPAQAQLAFPLSAGATFGPASTFAPNTVGVAGRGVIVGYQTQRDKLMRQPEKTSRKRVYPGDDSVPGLRIARAEFLWNEWCSACSPAVRRDLHICLPTLNGDILSCFGDGDASPFMHELRSYTLDVLAALISSFEAFSEFRIEGLITQLADMLLELHCIE